MAESNWMITYQRQREWIDGHGVLVWAADYLSVLGGVGFLMGLMFQNLATMFTCYVILALASLSHVFHCRYPLRLRWMVRRVRTSWMARGMVLSIIFTFVGFVQLACQIILTVDFSPIPIISAFQDFLLGSSFLVELFLIAVMICKPVNLILCIGIWLYESMMLCRLRSVPIFNNGAVPMILLITGALGGSGMVAFYRSIHQISCDSILRYHSIFLIGLVFCLISFFFTAKYAGAASADSIRRMCSGKLGVLIGFGTVLIGVIVPAALIIFGALPAVLTGAGLMIGGVASGACFTYALFKAAVYNPIVKV